MLKPISIEEFDYQLIDEKIAKYPLEKRDLSKLLIYKNGYIEQSIFKNITSYLPKDSLLIVNNTKVIYARLIFKKITGSTIEIFCLKPYEPVEYNQIFASVWQCTWECIVGNAKKWKSGNLELHLNNQNRNFTLKATKIKDIEDKKIIQFIWNEPITFSEVLQIAGSVPIPPYLNRQSEEKDKQTYQTVYSKIEGSVAAPTAGLHFTAEVLEKLRAKNIKTEEVTLHVGAGTFKPVSALNVLEHQMHAEFFVVTKSLLKNILSNFGNITSVGTTSMRALESIYWIGVKLFNNLPNFTFIEQFDPYLLRAIPVKEAISIVYNFLDANNTNYLEAETQIMIFPGYDFKIVNNLITNFHQPRSTLLLLVAAFVGQEWKKIYNYAIENNFRFLSYGDSSLLIR